MHDSRPLEDPSEIPAEQRQRRNRSLRRILMGIALSMLGMALIDQVFAPPGESRSTISLAMAIVALMAFVWFRSIRPHWETPLVVLSALLFSGWAVYSYGSVRSAASLGLMGAVVMAGTYLRLRSMVTTAAAALLILAALTWAEVGGLLGKAGMAADLRFWAMGSTILMIVGALLHHTRLATDEAQMRRLNQLEDRHRLELERDLSLRRFRRVFQLNPTPLLIQYASTQTALEANPAFERRFGLATAQLEGQPVADLWVDAEQWKAHCLELFEHGRTGWASVNWRHADGEWASVSLCSELIDDPDGALVLTTIV